MKKLLTFFILIVVSLACIGQTVYNAAYVKQLYAKRPTYKSNLCPACKEWDNDYYKSIADTAQHRPIITYYLYTKEHADMQDKLNLDRKTSPFGSWHPVPGQPNMAEMYRQINKTIGKPNTVYEIALGHCVAWITLAYTPDGAILSDTYDFNEAAEYQGQNIGTEIATENLSRQLVDSVGSLQIWCGTFGESCVYNYDGMNLTVPTHYWKIIQYGVYTRVFWMPNLVTEKQAMLPQREITIQQLIQNLGWDPRTKLH